MSQKSKTPRPGRFWRRLARVFGGVVLVLLIVVLMIFSRMSFRTSDADVNKYFSERKVPVQIIHQELEGRSLRWLQTGDRDSRRLVVFVHGAPGSSDNFHQFLADSTLLSQACLVSIDRYGYGYSDYGKAEISIARQADLVKYVADQYPAADTVVLVGHSYGGPIIAKCVVQHPERISAIVMLAPVNDPDTEPVFWFARFTKWRLTRWLLSGGINVSGDEKLSHVAELRNMTGDWGRLQIPVVHIHGSKDWMAPRANVDFSRKLIPANYLSIVELPKASHFIPWSDYGVVKEELLRVLVRK